MEKFVSKKVLEKKVAGVFCLVALLSACGGGSNAPTLSGFANVTGGTVDVELNQTIRRTTQDAAVGLTAYAVGITDDQIAGFSGIQGGANVGAVQTTGTATYDSRFGVAVVDNVNRSETFISGTPAVANERPITLTADFDAGTLTGTGVATGLATLDVNATIDGQTLGGSATVTHTVQALPAGVVNAAVQGQIGTTGVIGAFNGSDDNTVVAGGFVGTRN